MKLIEIVSGFVLIAYISLALVRICFLIDLTFIQLLPDNFMKTTVEYAFNIKPSFTFAAILIIILQYAVGNNARIVNPRVKQLAIIFLLIDFAVTVSIILYYGKNI